MVGFVDRLIFFPPSSSYDEHAPGLLRLQSEARDEIAAFQAQDRERRPWIYL